MKDSALPWDPTFLKTTQVVTGMDTKPDLSKFDYDPAEHDYKLASQTARKARLKLAAAGDSIARMMTPGWHLQKPSPPGNSKSQK